MSKSLLALALGCAGLLTWTQDALAFPPCPSRGTHLEPFGSTSNGPANATTAEYALAGDPLITDQMMPEAQVEPTVALPSALDPDSGHSGECKTIIDLDPLPPNSSTGIVAGQPAHAPVSGLGIVSLPDLVATTATGQRFRYRLEFLLNNDGFRAVDEWVDILQFDLRDTHDDTRTALYRLRKRSSLQGTVLDVIASTRLGAGYQDTLVATIPLPAKDTMTAVALDWASKRQEDDIVDTEFSVAINDATVHAASLPGTQAAAFELGVLDYNFGATLEEASMPLPSPVPPEGKQTAPMPFTPEPGVVVDDGAAPLLLIFDALHFSSTQE